jgi:hypothetical protein
MAFSTKNMQAVSLLEQIDSFEFRLIEAKRALEACPNKTASSQAEIQAYLHWEDLSQESGPKYAGFPEKMDKPYTLLKQDVDRILSEREHFRSQLLPFAEEL